MSALIILLTPWYSNAACIMFLGYIFFSFAEFSIFDNGGEDSSKIRRFGIEYSRVVD
jgi:hypothetical protein